ncbi:DEAD/DEAH box helicase [Rhodopseudomonas palustris]|uniref:DEAD/DEAH box helicase n=1 Tax=Rhodopseudomonas palustris TaxID=1076 RepID=UPI0020CF52A9|nr:DEAD/DEAH box helicase [Rhodopseudomonas palustris]MCP9629921.1 DEAD/DEAH box helicase [Rhodopseudomonas palustris]
MERTHLLTSFQDFGLADPISRALQEENYHTPTPIQAQTIPLAITGRDVVGIAQTGTGKTASFALPILHRILENRIKPQPKSCRVLVLSPTRELSGQILDSFNAYGRHIRLSATLAIGGVPMGRQVRALMQGVEVLVATPGRLLDLVQGNALKLSHVEFLVLDEADRMLDMGFINDIRKIVAKLPIKRQTLFFSATMPKDIADLAEQMLRDPARVAVTPVSSTVERINQRVIQLDHSAKPAMLAQILQADGVNQALVFTRTKHGADKVVKGLQRAGISADAIHGNKSQNYRERVLAAFRTGELRTLVATDIAARGIDVDGVSHVVNFDLPNIPETYVHRIGRTARAGADGTAISLCAGSDEAGYLRDIEKLIKVSLPKEDHRTPGAKPPPPAQQRGGQRNGGQPHRGQRNGGAPHQARAEAGANDPRRPRRGGNPNAGRHPDARHTDTRHPDAGRHEPAARPQHSGGHNAGHGEGLQGVAFLQRKNRPAKTTTQRPQR